MRRVSPPRSTSTQWPRPCSALSVGIRRAWACVNRVATFSSARRLSMKLSTTVVTESRSTSARLTRVRRKPGESDEKGPDARRRPMAAREAYSLYVERAGEGGNEADGPLSSVSLVRSRHAEDVFADVRHDQVVVDRGRAVEAGLAEFPLDVVLLGEAIAAVAVDARIARLDGGLRG